MNTARVASLLRQLAEAIDEEPPKPRPRRRTIGPTPEQPPSPDMIAKVRRTLRKQGVSV